MPGVLDRIKGQDIADQQNIPVAFRWYSNALIGDPDQPGQWSPFQQTAEGGLFVSIIGGGGTPILLPDDTDAVAEVATDSRIPTVARNYVYDPALEEFNRWRGGSDSVESVAPDATLNTGVVSSRPRLYQGTDDAWIRARANDNATVFASAARTATVSSATFNNGNYRGGQFVIDVTAITATPSVVFSIEAVDALSGQVFSLLDSVAIVAVGTTVLRVYPGLTAAANLVANDLLPWQWRVTATHADADSITYSVAANLML